MIIYKTRWFDRWARKEGLNELSLCAAVNEMTAGLYEADLGGGLFKKRDGGNLQCRRRNQRFLKPFTKRLWGCTRLDLWIRLHCVNSTVCACLQLNR
ncbi:type II toxin-antitoxin system RelE/ParE family toxin [Nostoc sp. XA013]|nr:type II toxin-antitoxin system RelE/ParE family toxin [Nostoc sp. XA013]